LYSVKKASRKIEGQKIYLTAILPVDAREVKGVGMLHDSV
jgi:hypothetical protein